MLSDIVATWHHNSQTMANQEEAIEHSIDQLIALNMDDSDEVELTHRPANNVTLTDAQGCNSVLALARKKFGIKIFGQDQDWK